MVFIIKKSSNGERSYEHLGLNKVKPNPIEDIISALEGLTIKLEIKFTDVIRQSARVDPEPARVNPEPARVHPEPARVHPEPARVDPEPARVHPEPARVNPEPARVDPEQARVDPEQARVESKPAMVDPEPARINPEPAQVIPRANLIRGQVTVGKTIQTCPIAVDDSMNPPGAYISYDDDKLIEIAGLISDISNDIEEIPNINVVNVGDIVFCKSREDNQWYRSMVEKVNGENADVFYFDWGIRETDLSKDRIKRLLKPELGLSNYPACAIKLKFRKMDTQKLDDVLKCETTYLMKVESYDNSSEAYEVTVLNKLEGF